MGIENTRVKTILCFEVNEITCQEWMLAVKPDGATSMLVMSPYFIKKVYDYAVRHKVLK